MQYFYITDFTDCTAQNGRVVGIFLFSINDADGGGGGHVLIVTSSCGMF